VRFPCENGLLGGFGIGEDAGDLEDFQHGEFASDVAAVDLGHVHHPCLDDADRLGSAKP
jgi:hypothetical protein